MSCRKDLKAWAAEEDDVLRARYASEGAIALARNLGRSVDGIHNRARKLSIHGRKSIPSPPRPLLQNPALVGTLLVPLTQGFFAIIDEGDGVAVGAFAWFAHEDGQRGGPYAQRSLPMAGGRQIKESLHRFLWRHWGLDDTPEIDHANVNRLDCRRSNLRAATGQQNVWNRTKPRNNTSGYKGVWRNADRGWAASIGMDRKKIYLGTFPTKEQAAAAYAAAAKELHGEFARTE